MVAEKDTNAIAGSVLVMIAINHRTVELVTNSAEQVGVINSK